MASFTTRKVWLDCDPGHDDAIAILMAVHLPNVELLGISTVHGNASILNTYNNALRLLYAYAAPSSVTAHIGAAKPLIRPLRADPEIHGIDGLGGVEGLPSLSAPGIQERLAAAGAVRAVDAMATALKTTHDPITMVATGPLTNVALLFSVYPDLLARVDELIFMGGGVGLGNRGPTAEFNILCDPEAAQIVCDLPLPKVMIPLNVTHKAIFGPATTALLLDPDCHGKEQEVTLLPKTALRHMLYTLIHFFAETYKSTFGFMDGPPVHDALTLAYVAHPEWFKGKRYRVDVELSGTFSAGETVVDLWDYRKCDESWGPMGKNVWVCQDFEISKFIALFLECVERADKVSPLN